MFKAAGWVFGSTLAFATIYLAVVGIAAATAQSDPWSAYGFWLVGVGPVAAGFAATALLVLIGGVLAILKRVSKRMPVATSNLSWNVDWTSQTHATPGKTWWRCEVQQLGPGDAERVVIHTRVHAEGQGIPVWYTWVPSQPPMGIEPLPGARPIAHPDQFEDWDWQQVFPRNRYAWREQGTTNNGKPFKVEVRVCWSEMPDTRERHELIEEHEFARDDH